MVPLGRVLLLISGFGFAIGSTKLDVSYLHNVPASKIAAAVGASDVSISNGPFTLDIGGSCTGNDGLQLILESLLMKGSGRKLSIVARMNQLTSEGAGKVLGILLDREDTTSLDILDFGWNHFSDSADHQTFLKQLRRLVESQSTCPSVLRLDSCGLDAAACRSIGKALINRFKAKNTRSMSLHLRMNPSIGDAGAAALAAAIRSIAMEGIDDAVVFQCLDLSACQITDAGAFALAQALESTPNCIVENLDLSNNKIGEEGAAAIGRALIEEADQRKGPGLLSLDMSGNKISDRGVADLAIAMEKGRLPSAVLRSCNIQADGARLFGASLRECFKGDRPETLDLQLDLSGNPLGVLRGKQKDGGKYSASRLKSKATATAASYFGMLKKGLKDAGVGFGSTVESDDEEDPEDPEDGGSSNPDARKTSCGIKALANALLGKSFPPEEHSSPSSTEARRSLHLGLRSCHLDYGAADALAAVVLGCRDELNAAITLDLSMNTVLEDDVLETLQSSDDDEEETLQEMAERYTDAVEAMLEARQRAFADESRKDQYWPAEETESDDDASFGGVMMDHDSDLDYESDDEDFEYD